MFQKKIKKLSSILVFKWYKSIFTNQSLEMTTFQLNE